MLRKKQKKEKGKEVSLKRGLIKRGIIVASLVVLLIILSLLAKNIQIAEFMTRSVGRFFIRVFGTFTSIFQFSIFEILLVSCVVYLLVSIVLFFVKLKKRGKKSLFKILNLAVIVLSVVSFYQLCAGFAYHRAPLELPAQIKEIDDEFAAKAANYFTDDFVTLANTLERDENGHVVLPYTNQQLNELLIEEYKRLENDYLNSYTPKFKEVGLSFLMAEFNISGFFFAPLGEAHVIKYAFDYERPFVAAHEMAHAKGVMRESEADLVASYLLLTSSDPYLRYSGYMENYHYYLLDPIFYTNNELYEELRAKIPEIVDEEIWASYEVYSRFNHFEDLGSKINDLYLRINGQKDGTGSYYDPGDVTIIQPDPTDPTDPYEPPIFIYNYSLTEKILLSICPL